MAGSRPQEERGRRAPRPIDPSRTAGLRSGRYANVHEQWSRRHLGRLIRFEGLGVCLAQDLKHERDVAIEVPKPELGASLERERSVYRCSAAGSSAGHVSSSVPDASSVR